MGLDQLWNSCKRFVVRFARHHKKLCVGLVTMGLVVLAVCGIYGIGEIVKNLILAGEVGEGTEKVIGRLAGEEIEEGIKEDGL